MLLKTAEHQFTPDPRLGEPADLSAAGVTVRRFGKGRVPADGTHETEVAHVVVNQGRWVVECPWCPSMQLASDADRRFFCVDCGNRGAAGQWVAVTWPEERHEIEAELLERGHPANRRWQPGQSVADLAAVTAAQARGE